MTTEASDQQNRQVGGRNGQSELSPIDEVNRIVDEAFANVPREVMARMRPEMVRYLNEKAGFNSDGNPK